MASAAATCRTKSSRTISLDPSIIENTPRVLAAKLSPAEIRTALTELEAMGLVERFRDVNGRERFLACGEKP